jgi:dipeptidyl aminopeptidase/acylaminoacyl peptidase
MAKKEKRLITAQDIYKFHNILSQKISPDGTKVVYSVQYVDPGTEKKHANLWLASTNSNKPIQISFGKQTDMQPIWSPDGMQIAFLSNREDEKQSQIYLLPVSGGEARPLSNLKGEFASLSFSPEGKSILFQFRKKDEEDTARESSPKKKELGIISRRINRPFFKLDGYGYLPKERWHICMINVTTGKVSQLTSSDVFDELNPAWSPRGKQIVYQSNVAEMPDLDPDADDLFILDLKKKSVEKIITPFGPKSLPSFSPDGKWIAYFGYEGKDVGYKNSLVWLVPSDSSIRAIPLTEKLDIHAGGTTITDFGSPTEMGPTWSADGSKIFFQAIEHGSTHLCSIDVKGEHFERMIDKLGVVGSYSFNKNGSHLSYHFACMDDPGQIDFLDLATGKERRLTNLNQDWLKNIELGDIQEVWFKGADGNDLQGWILKPPHFDPSKKYPSILEIHGGPQVQYGHIFMHEFYFLAAHGYVVYFTNPRGGRGYGEDHTRAIHGGKWGTVDYLDLMSWTDFIEKQSFINPSRMGVTGGSYGGYMTAWIIGHTNRFKAAVAQRVVSNLLSMWGSSDFNWSFQSTFDNQPPYENIDSLWECSPMKHLGNAKTPTLVIHSQADLRCAIEQGEQLFIGLRHLGVDTEFLVFPDSPHGLSRVGRTDRRIARLNGILDWFERYLK